MLRSLFVAAALVAVPLATTTTTAHASGEFPPTPGLYHQAIPVGQWSLTSTGASTAAAAKKITVTVVRAANGSINLSGFTGCNSFTALGERAGNADIAISEFDMTRRECDAAATSAENDFVKAFSGQTVRFDPATSTGTTFFAAGHDWRFKRLTGTPAVPANIQGNWKMFNGTLPALRGANVTLKINSDGSFTGNADCNDMFGDIRTDGTILAVTDLASTRLECPGYLRHQELDLTNAFHGIARVETAGDRLYLDGYQGNLSFVRVK